MKRKIDMNKEMKKKIKIIFYYWHYLIRWWVIKRSIKSSPDNNPQLKSIRQNIMHENKEFQEKFRIFFTPYYHLCEDCHVPLLHVKSFFINKV